jgi:hypothetical protein
MRKSLKLIALVALTFSGALQAGSTPAHAYWLLYCYGEHVPGCDRHFGRQGEWKDKHISCGANLSVIARDACHPNKVKQSKMTNNRAGNRCGYAYFTVECEDE